MFILKYYLTTHRTEALLSLIYKCMSCTYRSWPRWPRCTAVWRCWQSAAWLASGRWRSWRQHPLWLCCCFLWKHWRPADFCSASQRRAPGTCRSPKTPCRRTLTPLHTHTHTQLQNPEAETTLKDSNRMPQTPEAPFIKPNNMKLLADKVNTP